MRKQTGRRRDVMVVGVTDKNGFPASGLRMLLLSGAQMTARTGGALVLVSFGEPGEAMRRLAKRCHVAHLITVEESQETLPDACQADVLCKLAEERRALALLFLSNLAGRMLAGEVAARTDAMIVTDVTDVKVLARDRRVVWNKAAFGGFLLTQITGLDDCLRIGVLQPKEVAGDDALQKPAREMHEETVSAKAFSGALPFSIPKLLYRRKKPALDLEHADVIVAGGRGMKGPEGFALLQELADALGGVVAASRFAVDQGWIGKECLVGQSGKTVRPRLYIACGISGSVQHITGMRNADCVVSVNTDKKALIFNVSDFCIIGNAFEIVPQLTKLAQA